VAVVHRCRWVGMGHAALGGIVGVALADVAVGG